MHYAWVIVGILAIVQIVDSSISFAAGVMVAPLSDSEGPFGWSVGIIGVAMAVFFLTGAIYAPISGEVTEANTALADDPAKVNGDAEGEG